MPRASRRAAVAREQASWPTILADPSHLCFNREMPRSGGPIDRRRLPGSKWTDLAPVDRDKHFEAVEARRDGTAVLVCVLSGRRREVSVAELGDDSRWRPGWH